MYHEGNRELQARFGSAALADGLLEKTHRAAFTDFPNCPRYVPT